MPKYTNQEKVDNLANSAIECIRKRAKDGQAPILMIFSDPRDKEHVHAIAGDGLDAQQIIKWLAESEFGRIH